MSKSSPEGIILGKGSKIICASLSVNNKKVFEIKEKPNTYTKISVIKTIESFLLKNGFEKMEPCSYANDVCNVVIQDNCYAVANNDGDVMYSDNHNIYWLVGYLTWMGFIDKNYEK